MPVTVRMSQSDFDFLQRRKVGASAGTAPTQPRTRKPKSQLPENIVEKQILDFLLVKGWTVLRQHVGTYVPYRIAVQNLPINGWDIVRINERGCPDYCAERLIPGRTGLVERFWLEVKGPKGKPSPHQKEWLYRRKALGWLAEWFDDFNDFPGPHSFLGWYRGYFA